MEMRSALHLPFIFSTARWHEPKNTRMSAAPVTCKWLSLVSTIIYPLSSGEIMASNAVWEVLFVRASVHILLANENPLDNGLCLHKVLQLFWHCYQDDVSAWLCINRKDDDLCYLSSLLIHFCHCLQSSCWFAGFMMSSAAPELLVQCRQASMQCVCG